MFRTALALAALAAPTAAASAQSLGTFTWQLQPYCNVVTVNVTGVAGVYTLEGFDDQCGAGTRAPLTGVATPNPDGTIGFGLNIVTSPGGRGIQVEARIAMAGLSGPWTDSDGNNGTFAFGQTTGGNRRPLPVSSAVIPATFTLRPDGSFLAGGSAGTGSTIPASGPGTRLMWHPEKSALRAGSVNAQHWDDLNVGAGSVAFGLNTTASGFAAFAHGEGTWAAGPTSTASGRGAWATGASSFGAGTNVVAEGEASVALGKETNAGALGSLAAGVESVASGPTAVAIGFRAQAGGASSMALGSEVVASEYGSVAIGVNNIARRSGAIAIGVDAVADSIEAVAIGRKVQAYAAGAMTLGYNASTGQNGAGSFVFGDRSTNNTVASFLPNEFVVRAAGGTYFFSNPGLSSGVKLAPNASAWSSLSDARSKANFRDLDGGDVLAKLAKMPIREWNYKAQDASIRHVGPTAQDFHAAFGLGEDPLRISTIDADGIALAGVSALAKENAALKAQLAELSTRLGALERSRQ
jgi:Chaperone of endosialidase/Head domain of trimeric autotransporter adhesin